MLLFKMLKYKVYIDYWTKNNNLFDYNISGYNYVVDIIEHFSRWIWSYPIKNKTGEEKKHCLKN